MLKYQNDKKDINYFDLIRGKVVLYKVYSIDLVIIK